MSTDGNAATKIIALDLADATVRSWWKVVAGVCLGLAAALLALAHVPKTYEAVALLDLRSERLPGEFYTDTVPGDDDLGLQLGQLRQEVMSDRYLQNIAGEIFPESTDPEEAETLIRRIRASVRVVPPSWTDNFEIRYRDSSPQTAADVANALAKLYVEENFKFRVKGAGETVQTLEALAEQKLDELEEKRSQITEFRARHADQLEFDRAAIGQQIENSRKELESVLDRKQNIADLIEVLEVQREQIELTADPGGTPGTDIPSSALDPRLSILQRELEELLIRYAENHPEVVAKKKEIQRLEAQPRQTRSPRPAPSTGSPIEDSGLALQIRTAQNEYERLGAEEQQIRSRITSSRRMLAGSPGVESDLDELLKDRDVLERDYRDLRSHAENAKRSESVERKGQGNQFEIINAAGPPEDPVSPKPLPVLLAGVVVGLMLFVGPGLLRGILVPMIRSEASASMTSDVPILVTIPTITTPAVIKRDRNLRWKNVVVSLLSVATLIAVSVLSAANLI